MTTCDLFLYLHIVKRAIQHSGNIFPCCPSLGPRMEPSQLSSACSLRFLASAYGNMLQSRDKTDGVKVTCATSPITHIPITAISCSLLTTHTSQHTTLSCFASAIAVSSVHLPLFLSPLLLQNTLRSPSMSSCSTPPHLLHLLWLACSPANLPATYWLSMSSHLSRRHLEHFGGFIRIGTAKNPLITL